MAVMMSLIIFLRWLLIKSGSAAIENRELDGDLYLWG